MKPLKTMASAALISCLKEMLAKGDENLRRVFPFWHPWLCQLATFQSQEPLQAGNKESESLITLDKQKFWLPSEKSGERERKENGLREGVKQLLGVYL